MKKVIILLMVFLVLTSCSVNDSENEKTSKNPITISVLYNEKSETPSSEDWLLLSEYSSRKNVNLKLFCGDDENYLEAIDNYMGSGNPPDVILKVHPGELHEYIGAGLILPISDYIDQMPYFNEYITKNNLWEEVEKLKHPDDKFYILPGYQRKIQVQQWVYRKDIFDKHGLTAPATYEEIFTDLVKLREYYGDNACITASWGGAHLFSMMGPGYNIPAGWSGTKAYDSQKDTWFFAPASENYREMLRFLNKCYEAEVLDPDLFTQSNDEFTNKILNNETFITVTWISSGFNKWNKALEANGFSNANWSALAVPESTMGLEKLPPVTPFKKGIAISAAAADKPYFSELIAFLDWAVYSEEGMDLTYWGVKGQTYEIVDGQKIMNPDIIFPVNTNGTKHMTVEYGMNTLFDLNENPEFEDAKKPQDIVVFLDESIKNNETADVYPSFKMTENEMKVETTLVVNLSDYITQSEIAFIKGDRDLETEWAEYITELEQRGYRQLEDIWNTAWQRYRADTT